MSVSLVGIDPGLVDTGAVGITLDTNQKSWTTWFQRIDGGLTAPVKEFVEQATGDVHVFIEQYVDRGSSFGTHTPMRALEHEMKRAIPGARLVNNTGVKKVVRLKLMELLDVADFPATHHRDLESAARIAIYGALKDDSLNAVLSAFVADHLKGVTWTKK